METPPTLEEFFGLKEVVVPANELSALKREVNCLIIKLVLPHNISSNAKCEQFWFWYKNKIPAQFRIDRGPFGRLLRPWRMNQNFLPIGPVTMQVTTNAGVRRNTRVVGQLPRKQVGNER